MGKFKFISGKISVWILLTAVLLSVFLLGKSFTSVFANSKVNVCHTGNGKNWVSVKVDKNAWDEHTSAHSDHKQDFLIDDGQPCPPEDGKIVTCDQDLPDELLVVDATRTITNSPDSGENGNNWAKDNFTQRMRVWKIDQEDSTFYCGRTDDTGTFDALAGQESPGLASPIILNGNEDGTFSGSTKVKIFGEFHPSWATSGNAGAFNFDIPAEKIGYSTHPNWIDKYFEDSEFDWVSWGWHYKSCGHGAWNNVSTGNSGDIVPGPTDEVCQTPTPTPTPAPTAPSCGSDEHVDLSGTKCLRWELGGPPPPPPAGGGQVQGISTQSKVLGASTMAGTGTFEENLYMAIMGIGGTLTAFGFKSIKKTSKKA